MVLILLFFFNVAIVCRSFSIASVSALVVFLRFFAFFRLFCSCAFALFLFALLLVFFGCLLCAVISWRADVELDACRLLRLRLGLRRFLFHAELRLLIMMDDCPPFRPKEKKNGRSRKG